MFKPPPHLLESPGPRRTRTDQLRRGRSRRRSPRAAPRLLHAGRLLRAHAQHPAHGPLKDGRQPLAIAAMQNLAALDRLERGFKIGSLWVYFVRISYGCVHNWLTRTSMDTPISYSGQATLRCFVGLTGGRRFVVDPLSMTNALSA